MGDEKTELDSIWADDLLGRRSDADFLQAFLTGRMADRQKAGLAGAYVLNIDAHWGAGKTFFLERFALQLEASGHIVARVNAWRDDHLDDPFIAILAAIDEALKPYVVKKGKIATAWKGVKDNAVPLVVKFLGGATKTLVKKFVGTEFVDHIGDVISGDQATDQTLTSGSGSDDGKDKSIVEEALAEGASEAAIQIESVVDKGTQELIDFFNGQNKATDNFRERLGKAISAFEASIRPPLFVFVDELDRCRPSYAVSLLERVKHLFDADNVVFVFATNSDQLQYSVTGAYGAGFNGFSYLKRFFDRTYLLTNPSIEEFVRVESKNLNQAKFTAPSSDKVGFIIRCCESYKMDLREVRHVIDIVSSSITSWRHSFPIDMVILLPLAIFFYRNGSVNWRDAQSDIPETFVFQEGYRINEYTMQNEPVVFKVSTAFNLLRNAATSIEEAIALRNSSSSPEQEYAAQTFLPEWNGKKVNRRRPSAQFEIGDLIMHAGKIIAYDIADRN
ncbi:P-loop NTPase fold protein [Mesorhizobium sp. GbtcB19]|uniref:KAP family P-loop NTPase fold protein n=1 Tax=Mesorhizobium sp. GbtcB19 TaxID=2824764 RepID=UPI001C30E032|nr:P-loop NTPase fold protein [Mesorhizobium sp. GbtcB19]